MEQVPVREHDNRDLHEVVRMLEAEVEALRAENTRLKLENLELTTNYGYVIAGDGSLPS